EEGDADSLAEAERDLKKLHDQLADLEISTLLNHEYDERSAVVTVRSGAGGDDATDWAQTLTRMYVRWAENRGYNVQELDTSTPRGRASSPRRSRSTPPMPTAPCPSRPAPTGSCASAPSTTRDVARPPSPPSRWSRSSNRPTTSRSTRTTCASTSTGPRARAGSR